MNLNDQILPGIGLAGIKLGQSIGEIGVDKEVVKIINGQKIVYLLNEAVCLFLDEADVIWQLSALPGYQGKLNQQHFIGEPVEALINNGWMYSEELDSYSS